MMDYKEMLEKERTIKGYDLVRAFEVADSYCADHGSSGHKRNQEMLDVIVRSIMKDDLYEVLHKSASESYEKAAVVADALDNLGKLVRSILAKKEEE